MKRCVGCIDEFWKPLRPAEPGIYKRAFQNGKMDLTQIEGLGDLLSSQTAAQRDVALASATGLGKDISQMMSIMSLKEPGDGCGLYHDIQAHIQAAPRTEMIKEGIRRSCGSTEVGKISVPRGVTAHAMTSQQSTNVVVRRGFSNTSARRGAMTAYRSSATVCKAVSDAPVIASKVSDLIGNPPWCT
eukprot:jgi/Picre1/34173/NNA_001647.t1